MTDKITHIGERNDDSFSYSPEQILQSTVLEIQEGDVVPTRALVLLLDDAEEGTYTVHARIAQMKNSEVIALMEYAKHLLLVGML